MILTDKEIRKMSISAKKCNLKEPLLTNFSEQSLQSESYDLSIGKKIYVLTSEFKVLDLKEDIDESQVYEEISLDSYGYVLKPKQYVLVSVKEKVTLPNNITAHVRPRTRLTRIGLIVSAQHCNSTYSGELKLGLFNATDFAIKISKDLKIAQIVFEELKEKPSDEKLYTNKKDAAYKNEQAFVGYKVDEINKMYEQIVSNILSEK